MWVTRRYWTIAGFGGVLAVLAVVLARPLLLVGAAGLGAWLLARQYVFVRALGRTLDELTMEYETERTRTPIDETVSTTLEASLPRSSPLDLSIEARPPVAATGSRAAERTVAIPDGESEAGTAFALSWPVAGSFRFDSPVVTAIDPRGLFGERVPRGPEPAIVVEPRGPTDVHVGQGGERVATAYGEHETGRMGSGLDPAELREYVPGDTANRIDWKATARRGFPHVREYEVETDYTTMVVIDRREGMRIGPPGETKLDYARHVALAFVTGAREFNDPLGLFVIGDGGLLDRHPPAVGTGQYAAVRDRLHALDSTARTATNATNVDVRASGPAVARDRAALLRTDRSSFGSVLRPFFASTGTYIERIDDDPLFETTRTYLAGLRANARTVLFTDDTHRVETRETVKLARQGDDRVLVFLTPSVLFEPGGLTDLDSAYERYVDFEEFRRELGRLERVSAFEVGPDDRLEAVLAAGSSGRIRQRRERRPA